MTRMRNDSCTSFGASTSGAIDGQVGSTSKVPGCAMRADTVAGPLLDHARLRRRISGDGRGEGETVGDAGSEFGFTRVTKSP